MSGTAGLWDGVLWLTCSLLYVRSVSRFLGRHLSGGRRRENLRSALFLRMFAAEDLDDRRSPLYPLCSVWSCSAGDFCNGGVWRGKGETAFGSCLCSSYDGAYMEFWGVFFLLRGSATDSSRKEQWANNRVHRVMDWENPYNHDLRGGDMGC